MTDLLQQKRRMNWYNQEKVNNMSFGDSEWPEACKILDLGNHLLQIYLDLNLWHYHHYY